VREDLVVGEKNITNQPMVHRDSVIPPLHVKLTLIVKVLDTNGAVLNTSVTGTEFARKLLGDELCVICILLCISHKYNIIVCVSMTSSCSLNRSATFLKIGKMGSRGKLWK